MESISDVSLNDDESDPAAKPPHARQPMVVVQYRERGVPWWLLSLLTVLVPICTVLIYHSLVVGRYRAQTVDAAEAVRSLLNTAPRAEVKKAIQADAPLALNSQPIATTSGSAPATGAATPSKAAASAAQDQSASPASAASSAGPVESAAAPGSGQSSQPSRTQRPGSGGGDRPPPSSLVSAPARTTDQPAAGAGNAPSIAGDGATAGRGSEKAATRGPGSGDRARGGVTSVAAASTRNGDGNDRAKTEEPNPTTDPFEEFASAKPARTDERNPDEASALIASAKADDAMPAAGASGPGNPPPQPRLPTKEESERQFREEAAQNAARIREQEERQAAELAAARYEERVKFRDELRTILKDHHTDIAMEINELVKRYPFDGAAERLDEARRIWRFSRGATTQAAKVRMVRALDIPESMILNFISNDLNSLLHTRYGPQNENELRTRAANQLLHLELPPPGEMPSIRQPVNSSPGRTARYRAVPFEQPVQRRR